MTETILRGLGVSGFRSFGGGSIERVAPMEKVHLLAGPNNSGKSNVLQLASRGLPALRQGREFELADVDIPTTAASPEERRPRIGVLAAVNDEKLAEIAGPSARRIDIETLNAVLSGGSFLQADGEENRWFEFEAPAERGVWATTPGQLAEVDGGAPSEALRRLSNLLTATSGGPDGQDATRILNKVVNELEIRESLPEVASIAAFRQIEPAAGDVLEGEYNGPGLIDELAAIQNPGFGGDRRRFDEINNFVRTLFDDPEAQIEVPHHRETIFVHHQGRRLPLENFGTGLHEVIILAAAATVLSGHLVCIEEPEIHLHPTLQRSLLRYLAENTDNQYLIATHSAHMLDSACASITAVRLEEGHTVLTSAIEPHDIAEISARLGARASDLVQANAVIWVEGPSDRWYIKEWISRFDPELVEGVHYSIVFYGGVLLAHLSADDPAVDKFISLPRINRNFAVVIDSDRAKRGQRVNKTKARVRAEVEERVGPGSVWVTQGYTIENYVPSDLLKASVREVHPRAKCRWSGDRYADPLRKVSGRSGSVNKTAVAQAVMENWNGGLDASPLDLRSPIRALVKIVRKANDLG